MLNFKEWAKKFPEPQLANWSSVPSWIEFRKQKHNNFLEPAGSVMKRFADAFRKNTSQNILPRQSDCADVANGRK